MHMKNNSRSKFTVVMFGVQYLTLIRQIAETRIVTSKENFVYTFSTMNRIFFSFP